MPLAPRHDDQAAKRRKAFLDERLHETREALEALRGKPFELVKAWNLLIAENGALEPRPASRPGGPTALLPDDIVAVPPGMPLTCAMGEDPSGAPVLFLYQQGQVARLADPELFDFGLRLAETGTFVAREACTWTTAADDDWDRVRELLETLIESGMLSVQRAKGADSCG
jgi:hypothetical protein